MKNLFLFIILSVFLFSCKKEEIKPSINSKLKKELADIWFADQAFRTMTYKTTGDTVRILAQRMKVDTTYLKRNYISLVGQSDSQNSKRIEEIIREFGYPGKELVGKPENTAAWIVIQHDTKLIPKYLPLLRKAVQNGDLDMQALALTEDRNLMMQGKKQMYGSQFSEVNGKPIFWPIENLQKVNELRKEAGFDQTIEEYGQMNYGEGFEYKEYSLDEARKIFNPN